MIVTRDLRRTVFDPPVAMLYEECEIPPGMTLDAWRRGAAARGETARPSRRFTHLGRPAARR